MRSLRDIVGGWFLDWGFALVDREPFEDTLDNISLTTKPAREHTVKVRVVDRIKAKPRLALDEDD